MPKGWRDLVSDEDSIFMVREWVSASPSQVTVLPAIPDSSIRTLEELEVTTRSPMGAVAFHTGGLLIDHGWVRVLGSGHPRLPRALDGWNFINGAPRCKEGVLIADDVLGGFFAWFREPRTIHYLAPDTLKWEDSELGYSDWLEWCLSDRLAQYYADYRWDGWAEEIGPLDGAKGLVVFPPLFSEKTHIKDRDRGAVPVEELWTLTQRYSSQLGDLPEGATFKVVIEK
jgi:hypothetical protein